MENTPTIAVQMNQKKGISDGLLGVAFLVAAELMFFGGLISAYIVSKSGAAEWPPPDQPRLPIAITALNTLNLLSSALTAFVFVKKLRRREANAAIWLVATMLLGGVFLFIQGMEWVRLLAFGMTTSSSIFGAFFYTIIGTHGLHVAAGLASLVWLYFRVRNTGATQPTTLNRAEATMLFWYFVVGIWPVLYVMVYF